MQDMVLVRTFRRVHQKSTASGFPQLRQEVRVADLVEDDVGIVRLAARSGDQSWDEARNRLDVSRSAQADGLFEPVDSKLIITRRNNPARSLKRKRDIGFDVLIGEGVRRQNELSTAQRRRMLAR